MKHLKIEAFNIADARFKAVSTIWNEGESFRVGVGSECTETKKLALTLVIEHPEVLPYADSSSTTDDKHIQEYALTYLWTDYLGTHPYTYGSRLRHPVDQIEEVIKLIVANPNNRQLTMTIRTPEDVFSNKMHKDIWDRYVEDKPVEKHEPPCLTVIDLEVNNGKVDMTCYFRSWDAFGALNENLGGLYILLKAIVDEVNERAGTSYSTGQLIVHSKNCHIYERCYDFVENMLKNPKDIRKEMLSENYTKKVLKAL